MNVQGHSSHMYTHTFFVTTKTFEPYDYEFVPLVCFSRNGTMYEELRPSLIILYQHIDFNDSLCIHLAQVGRPHLHRTLGNTYGGRTLSVL
jgi:hypothetical protein